MRKNKKEVIYNIMKYSKSYGFYYTNRKEYEKKRHMSEKGRLQAVMQRRKQKEINREKNPDYHRELLAINILLKQDNKCLRCGLSFNDTGTKDYSPVIDYETRNNVNFIRGIIHKHCNSKINQISDSIEDLKKSIDYLEKYNRRNWNLDNEQTLEQFFD